MQKAMILLGSKSDYELCSQMETIFKEFGVDYELHISSAHRKPEQTAKLAKEAEARGFGVIIACAGLAAHLPGVVAAHTILPVIGVPLKGGALNGIDALYSVVQMPGGVPVATVAIDGIKNAAYLAIQILGTDSQELRSKMRAFKESMASA